MANSRPRHAGMTLVEMIIGMSIGAAVIAGMLSLFIFYLRSYNATTLVRDTSSRASLTLERMVIGVGTNAGLREAAASSVSATTLSNGWQLSYNTNLWFLFNSTKQTITDQAGKVVGTNIVAASVVNYTNSCLVSVTAAEQAGGRSFTNTMQTLVEFRN